MSIVPRLFPVIPAASASLLLMLIGGCSHPMQVDLPPGYTGKVSILCETVSTSAVAVHVGEDGTASKATCSRSREKLNIVRDGKPVQPIADPHWYTTGDGIVLGIDFEVQ